MDTPPLAPTGTVVVYGYTSDISALTLREIESSIGQLNLSDQVLLLQYLTPKIAGAVLARQPLDGLDDAEEAVRRYRAVADELAATSHPNVPSLTDAVSEQRR